MSAKELGVSVAAVRKWAVGQRQPRPHIAHKIIKLSRGMLTLEDIYAHAK